MDDVISLAQLNRSTLQRQLLLRRHRCSVAKALHLLAGVQAEDPVSPFVGLRARLTSFRPGALDRALHSRKVVRGLLMRSTIHAVTREDYLSWAETLRDVSIRSANSYLRSKVGRIDLDSIVREATELVGTGPITRAELGRALAAIHPKVAPQVLAFAARAYLSLVQVPPRGTFRNYGKARYVMSKNWLGEPLGRTDTEDLARRYLRSFGPAKATDFAAWSGLTGARELFDRMVDLRRFRDQNGSVLFDLPRRPIPEPSSPVGTIFLPALDNAILGYADRARIVPSDLKEFTRPAPDRFTGPILLDGFVAGRWAVLRSKKKVTMRIEMAKSMADEVREEGLALLKFLEPDASSYFLTVQ